MHTQEPVQIPLSKTKLWFVLLGAVAFVGLYGWYLVAPPSVRFLLLRDPTMIRLVGLTGLVLSGTACVFAIRKLGDNRIALELTDDGFVDNSSGIGVGLVRWTDVTAIKQSNLFRQQFLLVYVRNPDNYINRQTSALKRRGMAMNHKKNGTPINLGVGTLPISFAELSSLLTQRFLSYQADTIGEHRPLYE